MLTTAAAVFQSVLDDIRDAGLTKEERVIASPQAAEVTVEDGREVINFCANNYLGLNGTDGRG